MASPSVEDYIKAIYTAQNAATHVTTQELAERMRVSAPAVSKMLKRLTQLCLALHTPYHGVKLSETGEKMATSEIQKLVIARALLK